MGQFAKEQRKKIINDVFALHPDEGDKKLAKIRKLLVSDKFITTYPDEWFVDQQQANDIFQFDAHLLIDPIGRKIISHCVDKTRDAGLAWQYLNPEIRATLAEHWIRLVKDNQQDLHEKLVWLLDLHPCYLHPSTRDKTDTRNLCQNFLYTHILQSAVYPFLTISLMNNLKEYAKDKDENFPSKDFKHFVLLKLNPLDEPYQFEDNMVTERFDRAELLSVFQTYTFDQALALVHFIDTPYLHHLIEQNTHFAQLCLQEPFFTRQFTLMQWAKLVSQYNKDNKPELLQLICSNPHFIELCQQSQESPVDLLSAMGHLVADENQPVTSAYHPKHSLMQFYGQQIGAIEGRLLANPLPERHVCSIALEAFVNESQNTKDQLSKSLGKKRTALIKALDQCPVAERSRALRQALLNEDFATHLPYHKDDFKRLCDISLEDVSAVFHMRWPYLVNERFVRSRQNTPATVMINLINDNNLNGYRGIQHLPEGKLAQLHDINNDDLNIATLQMLSPYTDDLERASELPGLTDEVYKIKVSTSMINRKNMTFSVYTSLSLMDENKLGPNDIFATLLKAEPATPHLGFLPLLTANSTVLCVVHLNGKQAPKLTLCMPGYENPEKDVDLANLKSTLQQHYGCSNKNGLDIQCVHVTAGFGTNHQIIFLSILQDFLASLRVHFKPTALLSQRHLKQTPHVHDNPLIQFDSSNKMILNAKGFTLHGERDQGDLQAHLRVIAELSQRFVARMAAAIHIIQSQKVDIDCNYIERNETFEKNKSAAVKTTTALDLPSLNREITNSPHIRLVLNGYILDHMQSEQDLPTLQAEYINPENQVYCAVLEVLLRSPLATSLPYWDEQATDDSVNETHNAVFNAIAEVRDDILSEIPITPSQLASPAPSTPASRLSRNSYPDSAIYFSNSPYHRRQFTPKALSFETPNRITNKDTDIADIGDDLPMLAKYDADHSSDSETSQPTILPLTQIAELRDSTLTPRLTCLDTLLKQVLEHRFRHLESAATSTKQDYLKHRMILEQLQKQLRQSPIREEDNLAIMEPQICLAIINYARMAGNHRNTPIQDCDALFTPLADFLGIPADLREFREGPTKFSEVQDGKNLVANSLTGMLRSSRSGRKENDKEHDIGAAVPSKDDASEMVLHRTSSSGRRNQLRTRSGSAAATIGDMDYSPQRVFVLTSDWNEACNQLALYTQDKFPAQIQQIMTNEESLHLTNVKV